MEGHVSFGYPLKPRLW